MLRLVPGTYVVLDLPHLDDPAGAAALLAENQAATENLARVAGDSGSH